METSCLVIAGEKSGEEHFLSFYPQLKQLLPNTKFFGVGGDEMSSMGFENLYHLKDFSSWGIGEVIAKIPFYLDASKNILDEVKKRKCSTAILIDFQDFNLRLAKKLNKIGVKVLYYVAPQAWGWRAYRAKTLSQNVHTLFTILPFEKEWFHKRGVNQVRGVTHPSFRIYKQALSNYKKKRNFKHNNDVINVLLLPGSRNFEVSQLLPIYIQSINILKKLHKVKVHLVKTTSVNKRLYKNLENNIDVIYPHTDLVSALKTADVCLAASGTVTLSCALFGVPTIVCYKASLLTEFIFNNFISYNGPISLANLIHQKSIFPEYLQNEVQAPFLAKKLNSWISHHEEYDRLVQVLNKTKELIKGDDFDLAGYMADVIMEHK